MNHKFDFFDNLNALKYQIKTQKNSHLPIRTLFDLHITFINVNNYTL